jgi:hypothetical protein
LSSASLSASRRQHSGVGSGPIYDRASYFGIDRISS